MYVIENGGPPLLGRLAMEAFDMQIICNLVDETNVKERLAEEFPSVFSKTLGTYNRNKIKVQLVEDAKPIFLKPYHLPFKLKEKVEDELKRLEKLGIVKQVKESEYGTPIVPIIKGDKTKIAGNYKLTINKQIKIDRYPIPKIDDLIATLGPAKIFVKLDLSRAYNQFVLDDSCKSYFNISTHKGVYEYQRLMYGISSGPGICQREMEKLLQGVAGVIVFIDDILIGGKDRNEVLERTRKVLQILKEAGLTLELEKCEFLVKSVDFLGHLLDEFGLHMEESKVAAILKAPPPINIKQLGSFLGMISFYHKFIPNAATVLKPLYKLLEKNVSWNWSADCNKAYNELKRILSTKPILMQFDPSLPVKITTDASYYGVGAVISHMLEDGTCRPIAYASKTLNKSQQHYSQPDKEAYSLFFGVKKFYQYVYDNEFILETDHDPLLTIFGPKKGIPLMASGRLQRSMGSFSLWFQIHHQIL